MLPARLVTSHIRTREKDYAGCGLTLPIRCHLAGRSNLTASRRGTICLPSLSKTPWVEPQPPSELRRVNGESDANADGSLITPPCESGNL